MSRHSKFILTPISKILEDTVMVCTTVKDDMRSYSLSEYVMQPTFLKLTGASEQKLKCILWEMATDDYDFRNDFLRKNNSECSDYKSKNYVYNVLVDCIKKMSPEFSTESLDKSDILKTVRELCKSLFNKSIICDWYPSDYDFFKKEVDTIKTNEIVSEKNILNGDKLKNWFELMHLKRNRCAHNLLSYQENIPLFDKLQKRDYRCGNWFFNFFILLLLDNIFKKLFGVYKELSEE